ncbi:unnamed protein product [Rhizoctonia solani]|uniref:Smr domain-containing protein n=1 Tax=Rhizoctonia solani TaxID=456999 RepID=A0A8H3GZ02_9AGAM|nr:unnamed protein product [Rhizoctonia solani]
MDQVNTTDNTGVSHGTNHLTSSKSQESLEMLGEQIPQLINDNDSTALQGTSHQPEAEEEAVLEVWKRVMMEQLNTLGTKISQQKFIAAESNAKEILQQLEPTKSLPPTNERRKLGLSILESLSNIILSNIAHFSRDRHYLDIACYVIDQALPFLPPNHPEPADWLFNLAKCYELRYELTEVSEDIQNAIFCLENAVRLTPSGHLKRLFRIESLGDAHRRRWSRLKESNDLTKALEYYSSASSMAPEGSATIPSLYAKMAGLFSAWSQADRTHELEGLERAIEIKKYAITLIREGDARLPTYLHTLGRYYHHKFKRSGNKDDAKAAIDSQTTAMNLAPEGSTVKLNIMNDLGDSYQARFVYLGSLEDCHSAFRLHEQVVSLAPEGDPSTVGYLSSLGNSYIERFAYLGMKDDLAKAVEILSRVVSLTPSGNQDLPGRLNNLGLAYRSRFNHFGKLPDIDKAIELQGSAMQLSAEVKRHQPVIFANLGDSFQARFSRLKRTPDIESAILIQTRAMETTPDDHPTMPGLLDGLASSYELRFSFKSSRRKMDDLNTAIEHKTRAISLTPKGHPKLATYLNNLGLAYEIRFLQLGEEEDSDKAIEYLGQAVELTPDGHSDKPNWLNNLGNAYRERFRVHKELRDFDRAIVAQSQAISLTEEGHSNMPMMLSNMALSYFYRFESGNQEALDKAISLFQKSSQSSQGHPTHKFNSARVLASLLLSNSRPGYIQAYQSAVDYLPQIVWLGDIASTKFYQVNQLSDFIEEAAAAAIQAGEMSLALEWLEQGRSIVWGQHLQLQTSLDDLASVNSELANSLKEAADELHSTVSGIFASPTPDSSSYLRPLDWNVQRQHQVAVQYEKFLEQVRGTPGFEHFLRPKQVSELFKAARSGPVAVINVHKSRCDALVLSPNKDYIIHVPLPNLYRNKTLDFDMPSEILKRSSQLEGTEEYEGFRGIRPKAGKGQFESTLGELWVCVAKPILEALGYSRDQPPQELIHITWNTTGPLSLLPLHAAGDYSKSGMRLYDFAISSYIPTLSVLLRPNPSPQLHSRILAVSQEATPGQAPLPCTKEELECIEMHAKKPIRYAQLTGSAATSQAVVSAMEESDWIHLACHAYQLPHAPLSSSFKLHESDLSLQQIMQKHFQNKGLAFLSACQTASGDKNIPNESSHLAAGMLIAGYPSVIATMWAIADKDAPLVADQNQYPSLDPSLIAAFLTEFDIKQQKQLTQLHETLASLCSPVDDSQLLSSALEKASLTSSSSASDVFNDSSSSPTSSSGNSLASFSTPLGFLQNLFPDIDSKTLQSTLDEHDADNLESIIDILLSNDLIRDLQERGGWTDSDLTGKQTFASESVEEWAKVTKAQRDPTPPTPITPARKAKSKGKGKGKGKQQPSFVLGVVCHGQLPPHRSASTPLPSSTVVDPWTYIESVATRLNAILPNMPASAFSSAFHNPKYPTPADALRATLANLGNTNTVDDFALGALVSLLDDESGDFFDANLCLRATASQPDDAYHLIEILKDLDKKVPVIAHYTTPTVESPIRKQLDLPAAPPESPLPPPRRQSTASEMVKSPASPVKPVWGTVPIRPKAKTIGASYSQAVSIPGSSGWSTAVGMDSVEQSEVNENDVDACMEVAVYWKEKRHAALKQASEVYTRQKHEYGGEAALFYSNQAKDYASKEREWRLKAAKAGVKAKQDKTLSKAIDLHGLTVHESLEIVKEGVNAWWSSAGSASTPREPLQIITGRGLHSKGNIPVIAPAVMKLLERDGWRAHKREGIVYVTGILAKR